MNLDERRDLLRQAQVDLGVAEASLGETPTDQGVIERTLISIAKSQLVIANALDRIDTLGIEVMK